MFIINIVSFFFIHMCSENVRASAKKRDATVLDLIEMRTGCFLVIPLDGNVVCMLTGLN